MIMDVRWRSGTKPAARNNLEPVGAGGSHRLPDVAAAPVAREVAVQIELRADRQHEDAAVLLRRPLDAAGRDDRDGARPHLPAARRVEQRALVGGAERA